MLISSAVNGLKKVVSKVTKQNMQEILILLREKKNVLLAVVLLSLYCRKGNITDMMLMGAIKLPNQDADLEKHQA